MLAFGLAAVAFLGILIFAVHAFIESCKTGVEPEEPMVTIGRYLVDIVYLNKDQAKKMRPPAPCVFIIKKGKTKKDVVLQSYSISTPEKAWQYLKEKDFYNLLFIPWREGSITDEEFLVEANKYKNFKAIRIPDGSEQGVA